MPIRKINIGRELNFSSVNNVIKDLDEFLHQ